MCVFRVFEIVQIVPNRATHHSCPSKLSDEMLPLRRNLAEAIKQKVQSCKLKKIVQVIAMSSMCILYFKY